MLISSGSPVILVQRRLLATYHAVHATSSCPRTLHVSAASTVTGPIIQTDANVPEGHTSLHTALYGSGGAEEHDAGDAYNTRKAEDDGSQVLPLGRWLADRDGEKPLGVYAIFNVNSEVMYIGYSRNIVTAVRGHASRVPSESAAYVRAMVFNNKAMATREHLEREVASWVSRFAGGVLPPGNAQDRELWEGAKALSNHEAQMHADKAAKLRKAMGEGVGKGAKAAEAQAAAVTAEQQRANMREAVEGTGTWSPVVDGHAVVSDWQAATDSGNWSQEVERQTQEAVKAAAAPQPVASTSETGGGGGGVGGGHSTSTAGAMVSPFAQPVVHRSIGENGASSTSSGGGGSGVREMSIESVDTVLNEVRPYLVADGGDVEVVAVEDGKVFLRLQGSCSTCAASSATMKMGIERALKAAFGDTLQEVLQVGKQDVETATVESVNLHLGMLRGAISSLGGKVEVIEVADGKAKLKYKGPPAIAKGITAAIRDRFPMIHEVVMEDG